MDLSRLTDDDLEALQNKQYDKLSDDGLQYLHEQTQHLTTPAQVTQPAPETPSKGEAALRGAETGATFGLQPQAAGLGAAAQQAVLGDVGKPGGRSWNDIVQAYQGMKQAEMNRNKEVEAAHPYIYGGSAIVGGAPAAMAGGEALKSLGMASKAAQAATLGGAGGVGGYTGTTPNPTLKGAATAAGEGALTGVAMHGVLSKLTPTALQKTGSDMVAGQAGIEPSENQAMELVKEGDSWVRKPAIGGIGKLASEQGALPVFGGTDARLAATNQAIDQNYQKLNPLLDQAQKLIDKDPDAVIQKAGSLNDKLAETWRQFKTDIGAVDKTGTSQARDFAQKMLGENEQNFVDLMNNDGDLQSLNAMKQRFQNMASTAKAYNNPDSLTPKGKFYSDMASTIRQHIEDLANAADPDYTVGKQVADINNNVYNLIKVRDGLQAVKSTPPSVADVVKKSIAPLVTSGAGASILGPKGMAAGPIAETASQLYTDQSLGQNASMLGGKAAMGAGQLMSQTPGIVQDFASSLSQGIVPAAGQEAGQSRIGKMMGGQSSSQPQPASDNASGLSVSQPFLDQIQQAKQSPDNAPDFNKIDKGLYDASDEQLHGLANQLQTNPATQHYSDALRNAISNGDPVKKNAIIFAMQQNPQTRDFLGPSEQGDEESQGKPPTGTTKYGF